jgi:NADP-dependent 3-hydroxy acid dehydrogenase YdfG
MELKDQVIAITGASAGIGEATARLLAARGARVVLGARREDALARIVADIEADGGHATACTADVTRAEDLRRLVKLSVEQFGRLDALVANAGVATVAPLADGTLADWNAMIDVNLRGVLHGIAAALPVFTAQQSGHFITVTSTAASKWVPGQGVYAATGALPHALRRL